MSRGTLEEIMLTTEESTFGGGRKLFFPTLRRWWVRDRSWQLAAATTGQHRGMHKCSWQEAWGWRPSEARGQKATAMWGGRVAVLHLTACRRGGLRAGRPGAWRIPSGT